MHPHFLNRRQVDQRKLFVILITYFFTFFIAILVIRRVWFHIKKHMKYFSGKKKSIRFLFNSEREKKSPATSYFQGWVDLTSGYSNASGLLPTVGDSSRRMIRRHAIGILIHSGGKWLSRFGTFWMWTWWILHTRQILYAPGGVGEP